MEEKELNSEWVSQKGSLLGLPGTPLFRIHSTVSLSQRAQGTGCISNLVCSKSVGFLSLFLVFLCLLPLRKHPVVD